MNRPTILTYVNIGIIILGILGATWDLDEKIVELLPALEPVMGFVGMIFLSILFVVTLTIFISLVRWTLISVRDGKYADKGPLRRRLQHFRCDDIRADDIPEVMSIYGSTTPGRTSLDVSNAVYGKCRKGWKKVIDVRNDEIVGYFIVLPLTKTGEDAIANREFGFHDKNAVDYFRQRHTSRGSAYIGMVGAREGHTDAKAFAINRLKHFVNSGDYGRLYARAATDDGLRLLKAKGFKPVFPEDRMELDVMFVKDQ